jgi:flavin-dependent dehydrogenase
VTVRAARLLPFALDPVVEDVVDRVELGLFYRRRFEHRSARPIVLMTQRRHLDAYLVEHAAAAGADFRDGVRVGTVTAGGREVEVRAAGLRLRAAALIGADGVNGITARALGLCARPRYGVALEGNVAYESVAPGRYRGRVVFELGVVRGGYGWVFAKGDHANIGVGGWAGEAPRLRTHLARLCREHGVSAASLTDVRGHRLPVAEPSARLASGRALVAGDAAGLVDPLSGDGIYEAVTSGAFAADAVLDVLAGRASGLEPYERRVKATFARDLANAWAAKHALDRFPRLLFTVARLESVQRALERLARNDPHPAAARRLGRPALIALGMVSRTLVSPVT